MVRDLRRNENGLIFIVVLMIVIVMMTLTISLLGVNVTQTYLTEGEYRRARADLAARSAMYAATAARFANSSQGNMLINETIDGRLYSLNAAFTSPTNSLGYNATSLNVIVNY